MLTFCGSDIELFVDTVLSRDDGPVLCRASDYTGRPWLIVRIDDEPEHLSWLCVPVSQRAMEHIAAGRAETMDVIRHSSTGAVELIVVDRGRTVPDACFLCPDIPAQVLEAAMRSVPAAA